MSHKRTIVTHRWKSNVENKTTYQIEYETRLETNEELEETLEFSKVIRRSKYEPSVYFLVIRGRQNIKEFKTAMRKLLS